jgi:hypothetical protein
MTHTKPPSRRYLVLIPVIWINLVALFVFPSFEYVLGAVAIVLGVAVLVAHLRYAAWVVSNAPNGDHND